MENNQNFCENLARASLLLSRTYSTSREDRQAGNYPPGDSKCYGSGLFELRTVFLRCFSMNTWLCNTEEGSINLGEIYFCG